MTVMDEVLSRPPALPIYSRRLWESLQAARHLSTRFVFSERASELVGRFALECSELVLGNRQFAIPPFETTYVELDSRAFHKSIPPERRLIAGSDTDVTLGYLCHHQKIYSFVRGDDGRPSVLNVVAWSVVAPESAEPARSEPISFAKGDAEWLRLAGALGPAFEKIDSEDLRLQLTHEIGMLWLPPPERATGKAVVDAILNTAGDVRNVWASLLWINRPSKVVRDFHPAGARMDRGKRVAFRAYHTIDIDLTTVRRARDAIQLPFHRASPVNHKVRGEFHHRGGDPSHGHTWPLIPDDRGHWVCFGCGRKRYWVKEHRRGDPTKGVNDADYGVTVRGN